MKDFDQLAMAHGYSPMAYLSGHPVAATAALTNMDIIENEAFAHGKMLRHIFTTLARYRYKYDIIGDVRGKPFTSRRRWHPAYPKKRNYKSIVTLAKDGRSL